jgi:hypothetical protein
MTKWRASHAWITAVDVYESLSHTLIRPWLSLSMNELTTVALVAWLPPRALAKCRSSSSSMMVPWPDP